MQLTALTKIIFGIYLLRNFAEILIEGNNLKNMIMFYRVMQNICHLNVTTAHGFLNTKGQEIGIQNYILVIGDIVVLIVKPHSLEGKQKYIFF